MVSNRTRSNVQVKSLRGPPRLVRYARSASQTKRNRAYRECCTWWTKNATDSLRAQWLSYGPGNLTAFNAFLSVNVVRVYNDLPVQGTPPGEV